MEEKQSHNIFEKFTDGLWELWERLVYRFGWDKVIITFTVILILDVLVWTAVFSTALSDENLEIYFLDVGQGDSQLIDMGDVEILIDGGPPNGEVVQELAEVLPFYDRHIDLVVLTHPQTDHFGGLIEVAKRYDISAFVHTGRVGSAKALGTLEKYLNEQDVRSVTVRRGDRIKYGDSVFNVLAPDKRTIGREDPNDASVVMHMQHGELDTLFTGDITSEVEKILLPYLESVDVLKIPHHGSRYSSSFELLKIVRPKLSVIQVGDNSYGHPTGEVLDRLESVGSKVYRNDKHGTIKLEVYDDQLLVAPGT